MRPPVANETIVLDGRMLRLSFQSAAPCFACDLTDTAGATVKTAPILPAGRENSCLFELTGVAAGVYAIRIRSGGGTIPFGGSLAARQKKTGRAGNKADGGHVKLAASAFDAAGGRSFATVYVEPATSALRLRLSPADDFDVRPAGEADPRTRFSVVSAVYNVEKYLDQFFASIVGQSLDFTSHIELVMVDDGSTDRSAAIVGDWQRRYPGNIRYIRKENGGPASARTLGLAHAAHAWLTFIDPDDFVDRAYFAEVADALRRHGEDRVAMVSCNIVFHIEARSAALNAHPLRFRFAEGEKVLPAGDLGRFVQLSTATAFVRKSIVEAAGLEFDSRVRPGFEDAHFIGRYLLSAPDKDAVFLPQAIYFYRKRADESSIVDGFESHPEWYGDHLRYGYLGLLNAGRDRDGRTPRQVQNTVLYSLLWKFRYVIDRPDALAFLDEAQQEAFYALLTEVMALIDAETIMEYDLTDLPFFYRVGILNLFKDADPPAQVAEVTGFDAAKSLARVSYWTRNIDPSGVFRVGARTVAPAFRKARRLDFAGRTFAFEHIAWVPVEDGRLRVSVNGTDAAIAVRGRRFPGGVGGEQISTALRGPPRPEAAFPEHLRLLRQMARSPKAVADFRDAWVFIDRDSEADDSAEHLYRHVRERRPDINAFFVLARDTPHWRRLEADGFRLIGFNEAEHGLALLNAAHLISSQADHYVTGYLDRAHFGDMLRFRFTYLRHGVSKDDTSAWLNQQEIDCLLATTPAEYESIVRDGSAYKFTRKEVVLTGLPRHDVLLRGNSTERRFVVVMPTWRSSLTGPALGPGNARSVDPAFFESEFARRWRAFLRSPRLAALAARGHEIVFVPHPNMEHYLDGFGLPEEIGVRRFSDERPIHEVFQTCAAFVTDYSSKAFDVAYLGKPVVYYQFDPEVFFGGGHLTRPGYFDYGANGFGPVFTEEDAVLDAVEAILARGGEVEPQYAARADATFAFRDGRNSERALDAILALDAPARAGVPVTTRPAASGGTP